ncbi:unnamed protein product [Spirodela intermedia]|uniref:Uncharacterized protein n=1 Tax=Spirodela intermedia TaxID=51605 RepID=A0ABN7EDK0_SPIIN|nr:unnamed protein product [Spirodela intermedia]
MFPHVIFSCIQISSYNPSTGILDQCNGGRHRQRSLQPRFCGLCRSWRKS